MSLSIDGVWKAGVWATTVWANGVWFEGSPVVVVEDTHDGGREEAKRFKKRKEDLREMITFAYDKEYGLLPVAEEVREIVEPFVKEGIEIDWEAINRQVVEKLLVLQEKFEQEIDDEEFMVLH